MSKRSRPDHFTLQARKMGYPARSVFKLEEIQKKWLPMKKGFPVLDLGAAPGSWTLFALRSMGKGTQVVAVDIQPLEITAPTGSDLKYTQQDVFSDEAEEFLAAHGPYGCVLSDAAPFTSGNHLVDSQKSFNLAMRVVDLAEAHLIQQGNLVVKILQGGDEGKLRKRLRSLFDSIKIFKPRATRCESIETYMIGMRFSKIASNNSL